MRAIEARLAASGYRISGARGIQKRHEKENAIDLSSRHPSRPARRQQALLSQDGVSSLRWQDPRIIAWWSVAFPGFGHFLLHQFVRGFLLSAWEVVINTAAHVNEAIVYSFSGRYALAAELLEPRWVLAYAIVYLFAIWDSYVKAVENNKQYHLAKLEGARPAVAVIKPRTIASRSHEAVLLLLNGRLKEATAALDPQWLLFMPSVIRGAMYDACMTARDHNRLFRLEQARYFAERYPPFPLRLFGREKE
ncbi:hypothetical protein SAMN02799624_01031 [Paenibacillus sp. UNC496MF]|uniref:hypothetical protein n=1 Tax=Paenibacillus sp. UNC496MF TaxID=1502753 RepID=UPI0008F105F7|nr:hypothetical protein [Paenibacillus sp. UNC496MF]SFI49320.1 hypothetical protein SAMN02799624_01031 [Paenibacillus sp. UNC496MF]